MLCQFLAISNDQGLTVRFSGFFGTLALGGQGLGRDAANFTEQAWDSTVDFTEDAWDSTVDFVIFW